MINLVALPCLCVDVFDGTDELRAGGEALNFAVHASKFEEFNVSILGAVGQDFYAKFIMDSISDKRIDVSHVRVEKDKVTANNRTYLTADGDRYYKDDSWTGDIVGFYQKFGGCICTFLGRLFWTNYRFKKE